MSARFLFFQWIKAPILLALRLLLNWIGFCIGCNQRCVVSFEIIRSRPISMVSTNYSLFTIHYSSRGREREVTEIDNSASTWRNFSTHYLRLPFRKACLYHPSFNFHLIINWRWRLAIQNCFQIFRCSYFLVLRNLFSVSSFFDFF